MKNNSTLSKRKSNVTKTRSKKMKRNASETVTEAVRAMNKMAPPGDVTCVIIPSATILLLKSSWTMKLLFKSSGTKISFKDRANGLWKHLYHSCYRRSYLCSASWHSWTEMSSRWTGIGSSLPFVFRTSKEGVWSIATIQAGKSHNWGSERKSFWYKDIKEI